MKRSALVLCLFGLITALPLAPAYGQASRTWVSGTGDDTKPCSRTQPCLTFAVAFAATATGGEINVLDPGGFGNVTINRSVSIYNDGAGEAGIVTTATNAIIINAGPTDVINLRGLTLNGQGGGLGVHVLVAGKLNIQKCLIQQFGTGINIATNTNNIQVKIEDTTIINNTNGVSIQPGGFIANVVIERSRMDNNSGHGVLANGAFGGVTILSMSDSSASLNGTHGVIARSGAVGAVAASSMRNSFNGNQQFGWQADATLGTDAYTTVGSSMIAHNLGGAVQFIGNAQLLSYGTNQIAGPPGTGFSRRIAQD